MSVDPGIEPPSWFEAAEGVRDPLLNARALWALLRGAEAVDLLAALRNAATPSEAARTTGVPEATVRDVCDVLVANQVAERVADEYRLTPAWVTLTGPVAFSSLASALAAVDATASVLQDLTVHSGYGSLSVAERLAHATAVSPDPFSPAMVATVGRNISAPDVVRERLREDDRHLELGCGVAGRILCVLQALPATTAVGVELAPDLAAEARRRAEAVGVADRFEVVVGDAASVRLDGPFDVAFWSQFFFPEASRAGTLASAYHALRPGGTLVAPLLGDAEAAAADPYGSEAKDLAMARLVHGRWGVPFRSGDELEDEVRSAGFADVALSPPAASGVRTVVATRP